MKSLNALFCLLGIFFFSQGLRAENPWITLNEFLGYRPMCEAFSHGSRHTFQRKSCLSAKCDVWNYEIVVKCDSQAILEYTKSSGVFSKTVISQEKWQSASGNMLRLYSEYIESLNQKFALKSVVIENDLAKAEFEISNAFGVSQTGTWVIGKSSGIAQMKVRVLNNVGLIKGTDQDILLENYHQ